MLDRFFKATCSSSPASAKGSELPPAEQAPLVALPAISIDFSKPAPVASCLNDIFSDIIAEQPKIGFHV